eukprot:jgi/Mesen1/10266/ME000778S09603
MTSSCRRMSMSLLGQPLRHSILPGGGSRVLLHLPKLNGRAVSIILPLSPRCHVACTSRPPLGGTGLSCSRHRGSWTSLACVPILASRGGADMWQQQSDSSAGRSSASLGFSSPARWSHARPRVSREKRPRELAGAGPARGSQVASSEASSAAVQGDVAGADASTSEENPGGPDDVAEGVAEGFGDATWDRGDVAKQAEQEQGQGRGQGQGTRLAPGLYLVGTPIGNLEDISFRALRVLRSADVVLAEDTRHSSRLLNYFSITTRLVSYHQHSTASKLEAVMARLTGGDTVALVSDAGMPAISDPGAELVQACVAQQVAVYAVPGPSAVVTAVAAAGFPSTEFCFLGFPPEKASARRARLEQAAAGRATQVLYVAPHKLRGVLSDLAAAFGPARELTKVHEEFWRGTLQQAVDEFERRQPRGEFTLVLEGAAQRSTAWDLEDGVDLEASVRSLLSGGLSPSQVGAPAADLTCQLAPLASCSSVCSSSVRVSRKLVEDLPGVRRNQVYSLALRLAASADASGDGDGGGDVRGTD